MHNLSKSLGTTRGLICDRSTYDMLLGGGLNTSFLSQSNSQASLPSFSTRLSVFYSGDSQDTRRLGHIYIGESIDDYVDDYVVLREESAITALRTR